MTVPQVVQALMDLLVKDALVTEEVPVLVIVSTIG